MNDKRSRGIHISVSINVYVPSTQLSPVVMLHKTNKKERKGKNHTTIHTIRRWVVVPVGIDYSGVDDTKREIYMSTIASNV